MVIALAATLSTESELLSVISSSIAYDIYYLIINPDATEAQRLMVGFAVAVADFFWINPPGFAAEAVAFAFNLAAASFSVIFLSIFDRRASSEGAISKIVTGLLFTADYIVSVKLHEILP